MTPEELQEIIDEVLQAVRTNSKTIAQLTEAVSPVDGDYIELSGGRKVSIATLKTIFSGGGGGGVVVVQTTGQSTTAVMSQKAVTEEFATKQPKLTAGANITIEGNVISATGGGEDVWVKVYDETHLANTGVDINIGKVSDIKKVRAHLSTTYLAGGTGNGYFGIYGASDRLSLLSDYKVLFHTGLNADMEFFADTTNYDCPIVARSSGNNKSVGANWQAGFIAREGISMTENSWYRLLVLDTQSKNDYKIEIWVVNR